MYPEQLPLNPYDRISATGVVGPEVFCDLCGRKIPDDEEIMELCCGFCCTRCYEELEVETDDDC